MKKMMMKENDRLHGFTVTRIREVKETGGRLVEMTHDATGAGLVWVDNGAENKLFSVGFKTLPEDSTGVFHILEHSVLCGSDKFPVKEPFVELLKTSMNTFLNAMTYPDKTLYPVSSRIKQDYLNLAEVYLDAVFRPAILTNPNIFYQEGWHIDTTEGEPAYKGVVFNEMKGAMSDVDQIAERTMGSMLFPDNCYGFNSGGDPDTIIDLTYDKFIETYKRFYHPSNAYFYLDGDIPVEETLTMIESYLGDFTRSDNLPEFTDQSPVVSRKSLGFDAAGDDDKSMVACGRIIGSWEDRDEMLALSVVLEQLADTNESPVKRAVLSSGLAEDFEIYVSDGIYQPYLMMIFRGVEDAERDADELIRIACDAVNKAAAEGISHRDIEASINQIDFRFREYPEPQGLYRANAVFASWLYGGDPALHLQTNEAVSNLRAMADTGKYEELAAQMIGDKDAFSVLCLTPDTGLGKAEAEAESAFVKATVDNMDADQRAALEDLNSKLLTWQQTPDRDEDVAKIPVLELSDIKAEPEMVPTEVITSNDVDVLFHPIQTHGIVYINVYFPLTGLTLEDLPAAALITEFFKDLPTEDYDVLSLINEIRMHAGSMTFGLDILAADDDRECCTPCIRARVSVLEDKVRYAELLLAEILTRTKFDDKALMRELITQIDEEVKRAAVSSGHRLALMEARSHWSARDAAAEAVNGHSFMKYMHRMNGASDSRLTDFAEFAKDTIKTYITRQNAKISVTSTAFADVSAFIDMLPEGRPAPEKAHYESKLPRKLGIQVPSAVSFSAISYDMADGGYKMNGSMAVAANIISLAHLWNEIRVQGGAYGAAMSSGRTGSLFCYTYRDPNPARSQGKFATIPGFLSEFTSVEGIDIDGYIISAISNTEPLLSPAAKGREADDFEFSGYSYEDRRRIRGEMLSATPQSLASQIEALNKMADNSSICVVGPLAALEACEDLEIVEM